MRTLLAAILLFTLPALAQTTPARHDFLYTGEAHSRRIVLLRHGAIAWSYDDPGTRGEISDAVQLSNGNILYAHQFGITEINPAKQVVWNYDAPPNHETHTALPIGNDRVLFIENSDAPAVHVVNIRTGLTERQFPLAVKHPISVHGQFRHARLTPKGTLLVAHCDLDKVVEYDASGTELRSIPAHNPWGVTPLPNGNALITDRTGVREITPTNAIAWSWQPSDTPTVEFANLQQAWRLPNGNTLVNNWINEWTNSGRNVPGTVQAIELTPNKQVVWTLNQWTPPLNLGPATTIQLLDTPSAPENVHFGDIR